MLHVRTEGDRFELKGVLEKYSFLADSRRPARTMVTNETFIRVVNEF